MQHTIQPSGHPACQVMQLTFGFTASPMTDPWLITIQTCHRQYSGQTKFALLPEWEVAKLQPACTGLAFQYGHLTAA
jgi:hypothetical protein